MRAIYFLEIDGIKYYKCDSFWSKSKDSTHAKIHVDTSVDRERFFDSLIGGLKPYRISEHNDIDWEKLKKWSGSLYGYQTVVSNGPTNDRFVVSKDAELSKPVYLKRIDSVDRTGQVVWSDAVVVMRDIKINDILNEEV